MRKALSIDKLRNVGDFHIWRRNVGLEQWTYLMCIMWVNVYSLYQNDN